MIRRPCCSRVFRLTACILFFALPALARTTEGPYFHQDSARFRVYYRAEDAKVVRGLWRTLREQTPIVEQRLGLSLMDTVSFVVAPTEKEWSRLTEGAPLWANGIAYPQRGMAIVKSPRFGLPYGPLPVTAVHEYVHLLLETGAPRAEWPRWLDEGLAQVLAGQLDYMDNAVLARAAAARRLHSFRQIEGLMAMSAPEARQAYAESAVAVQLLQNRFGISGVSNVVHQVRSGQPFDEVFVTVFGLSPGAFESEYLAYVQRTFRLSLISDTQVWVPVLFVVFVLAAGLAMWRRRKRVIERWREEEARGAATPGEPGPPPFTVNLTVVRGRIHSEEDSDEEPPHDKPIPGD